MIVNNCLAKMSLLYDSPDNFKHTFDPIFSFLPRYKSATPTKLKIIDAYLAYVFFTGVIQFIYCCLVGTFPFNAFLSGFISCVGCFILGVCLRLQVSIFYYSITHLLSIVWSKKIILGAECQYWSLNFIAIILQVNPQNKGQFEGISPERAFADFVFAHIILHLVVMNFIGWLILMHLFPFTFE